MTLLQLKGTVALTTVVDSVDTGDVVVFPVGFNGEN